MGMRLVLTELPTVKVKTPLRCRESKEWTLYRCSLAGVAQLNPYYVRFLGAQKCLVVTSAFLYK